MADASTASLLPVIVGGVLTIAGGIVGSGATLLISWRQTSLDRQKRRAEKFEQLVTSVYEFDHWLDTKQDRLVHGNETKLEVSPFSKIEGLSAVYFPSFLPKIAYLKTTAIVFENWMAGAGMRRIRGELQHVNDNLREAYDPYIEARAALLSALTEYAKNEFQ